MLFNYGDHDSDTSCDELPETRGTRIMGDQNSETELLSDAVCRLKELFCSSQWF